MNNRLLTSRVLRVEPLTATVFTLEMETDQPVSVQPGQFMMVEVPGHFLLRPFAPISCEGRRITFAIQRVGEGTEILAGLEPHTPLMLRGPLGRGFPAVQGPLVLIGGGVGVAPLLAVASQLKDHSGPVRAFLGFNRAADVILREEFERAGVETTICTMDGSLGYRGNPVAAATAEVPSGWTAFACGPQPLLQAVKGKFARVYVSLESHMGCGWGVCNACRVDRPEGRGTLKICEDGPVFDAEEVELK